MNKNGKCIQKGLLADGVEEIRLINDVARNKKSLSQLYNMMIHYVRAHSLLKRLSEFETSIGIKLSSR